MATGRGTGAEPEPVRLDPGAARRKASQKEYGQSMGTADASNQVKRRSGLDPRSLGQVQAWMADRGTLICARLLCPA